MSLGPRKVVLVAAIASLSLGGCDGCGGNQWPDGGPGDGGGDGGGGCVDEDGDGYGRGCAAGLDCDDSDPFYQNDCPSCLAAPSEGCLCDGDPPVDCYEGPEGTLGVGACAAGRRSCRDGVWSACEGQVVPASGELCNDRDDDCDGEVDEGVTGECGGCDPSCVSDSVGAGGESGWDPRDDNSEGVGVDPESGGLILDSSAVNTFLIWVANTAEGSVSKVDVRTFEEVGRYYTGTDPSRTSVNSLGDVYVGNRAGGTLTKISALGSRCPDTNGDGVITTSSGHDLLPFGQDDCMLWSTTLNTCGLIRAVAAQDVYGPDGDMHPYVWVGGWDGCVWLLDGETGAILVNATPAPTNPYGFALDGHGNLWIESGAALGRIDTNVCRDDASCAVTVCGDDGDACVKQLITQPWGGYGITVDFNQRVWIGGSVARYDPSQPLGARWTGVNPGTFVHGIAADAEGWVWGAGWETVYRIDANDPSRWIAVAAAAGWSAKGAAVDALGNVWMINYSQNNATVITPGPTLEEATVATNVSPVFSTPYTYSDMTGSQMRFATRPRGTYQAIFTGCDDGDTVWADLVFDAFVPDRTSVLFRVRTADDAAELELAPWVVVATVPDDVSPASIEDALVEAGVTPGAFLELQVQLSSEVVDSSSLHTPVVYSVGVTHTCPAIVG